jgi:hypothetical protein
MEWKTPEEAQTSAFADCKGKAVALYNAMHSRGDGSFVSNKRCDLRVHPEEF